MLFLYSQMRRSALLRRHSQRPVGARTRARVASRRPRVAQARLDHGADTASTPPLMFGSALLAANNPTIALPMARLRSDSLLRRLWLRFWR